ncbi:hypothetical protein BKA80DRAFT_262572, partial [Phyllosticta citrichinensis]
MAWHGMAWHGMASKQARLRQSGWLHARARALSVVQTRRGGVGACRWGGEPRDVKRE